MKKRLVGTVVLGSLALIIIPLLLDGEGMAPPPITATIPPAPVINTTPIPDPVRPVIIADESAAEPSAERDVDNIIANDADNTETFANQEQAPPEADTAEPADTEMPEIAAEDEPAAAPPVDTAETTSTEARLDEQGLPEAWTVRLGSFGNRANADALVRRLIAADHKAYLRPVQSGERTLNGVFVGPVLTRSEANALKAELLMSFELDGLVQQFELEP